MIHPTAIVSKKAKIADDVVIGHYTVIEDNVEIDSGCEIGPFCRIVGNTNIGKNTRIFSHTVIGSPPQDLKYKGEKTRVEIGDNNIIREFVTINPGTAQSGVTKIGNNNLIMAYAHIAHDCEIGNGVIIANAGTLAGHVKIEDRVIIGGLTGIHQFVRIGKLAIIGGCSKVVQDVPPFSTVDGHPVSIKGLNSIGLQRAGFSPDVINSLKKAFKILFFSNHPLHKGLELLRVELKFTPEIEYLVHFVHTSSRGICL